MGDKHLVPAKAKWAGSYLASLFADVSLALAGLPSGVATVVQVFQVLVAANEQEAIAAAEAHLQRTAGVEAQLEHVRADTDELRARMTSFMRIIAEAGRHPDRELRNALGRFAARVLIQEIDRIESFEMAEALSRMTALDLAVLVAVGDGWYTGNPDFTSRKADIRQTVANVKWIHERIEGSFTGLQTHRTDRSAARLESMALVQKIGSDVSPGDVNLRRAEAADMTGWALTALGRCVLQVTEEGEPE